MNIVTVVDTNYVFPLSVVMNTASRSTNMTGVTWYVLSAGLRPEDMRYLETITSDLGIAMSLVELPRFPFYFYSVRQRNSLSKGGAMSQAAYAKAFIDRFLPDHVDRVLLLDADIVVEKDLTPLYGIDMSRPIAAVANIPRAHHHQFNSGVVLVDLSEWRKRRVADRVESFLYDYSDTLHSHDQHTLNLFFGQEWEKLPLHWNWIEDHYRFMAKQNQYSEAEVLDARSSPSVIHYAVSTDKPWKTDSEHPEKQKYVAVAREMRAVADRFGLDSVTIPS